MNKQVVITRTNPNAQKAIACKAQSSQKKKKNPKRYMVLLLYE